MRTSRRASPTPKTNSPTRRRFLAALLCPLVCLVLFPTDSAAQDALRELNTAIARLTARVTPAVVQILSDSYTRVGSGGPAVAFGPTTGSGVIISRDGFIVTNAHVVRGATEVQVQLAFVEGPPGRSVIRPSGRRLTGSVIGIDLETDLALVKVDGQDLPTLDLLEDSEQVRQGQLVLAFGSPLGLENSVSMGVISSVARQLQPDDRVIYIQTDAPINPGNSGGPLVDVDGNVVGINTMILSQSGGSDGVGFALPSNIVASVVEQLRERGVFQRGEIGVEAQSITPELASGLGLAMDHGVILADVHTGGPAYRSDLRVGDVVLSLNDKPMENARQFYVNLYGLVANRVVRLEILRGSERLSKSVTVTVRSDDPERIARLFDSQQELVPRIGILGVAVEDGVQEYLPVLRLPGGILVTALAVTSNAPAGLFLPGDVLYAVNGETLATVEALKATLSGYAARESVVFQIERQGRLSYVVARLR